MSANLEIEKKFIIKHPDISYLKSLPDCSYTEIEQIYLVSDDGRSERIRKRGKNDNWKYYHTIKYHITAMTRSEEERLISAAEYEELKKRADNNLSIIYKTRYCLPYEGHIIEIDVFPFWKKQAYMEIELSNERESYTFPPFIECVKDVTTERGYTNRALAECIPEEII